MLTTTFEKNKFRLPDFMIPGAAKSGTTSLYRVLSRHPDLYFPKNRKEPFYFTFGDKEPTYSDRAFTDHLIWKTREYLDLYVDAVDKQLLGDASTSYLYTYNEAIQNMRELYGDQLHKVKVIIILRHPIQRTYSHYTYLVRNGFETRSFEEAISTKGIAEWKTKRWGFDYIQYSLYADAVKAFLETFDDTLILLTEDLKSDPKVYERVFAFLGVEPLVINENVKANPSGVPKSRMAVNLLRKNKLLKRAVNLLPENTKRKLLNHRDKLMAKLLTKEAMRTETQKNLSKTFAADISNLEKLIDRDLSHWKSSTPGKI